MNFLQLWFEFSGILLEVRNDIKKLVSEALYAMLFVFRHATKNIEYLLSFLRLGWHGPRGNEENAAHSRSWGKHNSCLWWGAGQLTLQVFWRVTSPETQIALFSPRLSAVTFAQPSFSVPLSTRGIILCNGVLSSLTPIGWSPKIRMNFETCK